MTAAAWPEVSLGDIAESISYGVTASASTEPVGPQFLRITDIQDGAVDWDHVPWCECDARAAERAGLKQGDIVFARTGATTGKSFLIDHCPSNAVFASYLIRLRLSDRVDPRFVAHYFDTPAYWSQITSGARGAAQPGVNATVLGELTIPLPPMDDQQRIAAVLAQAQTLRSRRRETIALLDILTESVFHAMFGDPAGNTNEWPVVPLGSQVDSVRYGTGSPPPYATSGVPFIRATNIKRGTIDMSDLRFISSEDALRIRKCMVRTGDLIVVRSGVNTGDCAVIPDELDGACAAFDMVVELPRESAVFFNHLLNSQYGKTVLAPLTRRAAQPHLNAEQLRSLEVVSPPMDTRRRFAQRVSEIEGGRAVEERSAERLDELFASLQHRAFRGDL